MAENLRLFVVVVELGPPSFPVCIESSKTVDELKKAILNENANILKGVDAHQLTLYKVELPDGKNLKELVPQAQKEELGVASCELSELFPVKPPAKTVSIIVEINRIATHNRRPSISSHWCPRSDTVHHLFDILQRERFVQVRGTPGSGKTTLKTLFHDYILQKERNASVKAYNSWERLSGNLEAALRRVDPAYPHPRVPTYLLFDEAQDTYDDVDLWNNFFKSVHDKAFDKYYVILFCSYGSPSSRIVDYDRGGTPLILHGSARVSLWPAENPIGLFLSRTEFQEVVDRYHRRVKLDSDLLEYLFHLTGGHVGAIVGLLEIISYQKCAEMRECGAQFTLDDFYAENPTHSPLRAIDCGAFGRGLPWPDKLPGMPKVISLLRTLIKDGRVERVEADEEVKYCHQKGWIHSYQQGNATFFTFPSPLHSVHISWTLRPSNDMPEYSSPLELCCEAVKRFKPSQMYLPLRRVGGRGAIPALPEAQYKDEFYRSFFSATAGSVCITPEFATANRSHVEGRIDFFIPVKKWGVEITRNGDWLLQHNARFEEEGAYGKWLKLGDMTDYLLLDCRVNVPQKRHENIPNLFHAVFSENFEEVTLYDNKLETKGTFALLESF
ncbi:hypothetical protein APHAL10511_008427 [Amanita phalloides]|nr:hypothetical protein APHAL10511_008427 [Amanita phalloides]